MMRSANIEFIYRGALTKRFHTIPTLRVQNVGEHSFGVAWLCEWLTGGTASKDLIMAALAHDLAEHITGDIPAPAKRAMGIRELVSNREAVLLRSNNINYEDRLSEPELGVLKMADALDGMIYCLREVQLGNSTMKVVFTRFKSYVMEIESTCPCDGKVKYAVNYLTKTFEEN